MARKPMIFLKESELRALPIDVHRLTPILFAEFARMPSHKGKPKDCFLVINFAAVYFIRPLGLVGNQYKIGNFLSTVLLQRISYDGPKKRTISTKTRTSYFVCEHAEEATSCILTAFQVLMKGTPQFKSFAVDHFPDKIKPIPVNHLVNAGNIAQLRSVCLAARYNTEVSEGLLELLGTLEPGRSRTLVLDETCTTSGTLRCLSGPVVQMGGLSVVHLRNCAPYAICRIVYDFLKTSHAIRTFIFEGYRYLIPAQLELSKFILKGATPVALIFSGCVFSDDIFCKLLDQIAKLRGPLHRLTFSGGIFNARTWEHFVNVIDTGKCFRTLEVLEIDQIDAQGISTKAYTEGVATIVRRARCLRRFTLARFTPQISIPLWEFRTTNLLHEINLRGQDFSEPPAPFAVPELLHLLNFRECRFTAGALITLLENIAQAETPITLHLPDIRLTDEGWDKTFQKLPTTPRISALKELDWSGNPLPKEEISTFAGYFFESGSLRFLGIDRIFAKASIDALLQLVSALRPGQLWGLSLRGDPEHNFGGEFRLLLPVLDALGDIRILHLDRQNWSQGDADQIASYATRHPGLRELSLDGTTIELQEPFFALYQRLCSETELKAIGRPNTDIGRLFKGPPPADSVPIETLRNSLQDHPGATNASVRAFYMCNFNTDDQFSDDLYALWLRYPRCFLAGHISDPYFLLPPVTGDELVSLGSLLFPGKFPGLFQLEEGFIEPPLTLPLYPPPPELIKNTVPPPQTEVQLGSVSSIAGSASKITASLSKRGSFAVDTIQGAFGVVIRSESSDEDDRGSTPEVESSQDFFDSPLALPPAPSDPEVQSKQYRGLGYYQSFGEGLTINLDLPVAPLDLPEPPAEEE
jgi:hypothetical protein